jgi:hypothetical protein
LRVENAPPVGNRQERGQQRAGADGPGADGSFDEHRRLGQTLAGHDRLSGADQRRQIESASMLSETMMTKLRRLANLPK